jgi:hypothetical protein
MQRVSSVQSTEPRIIILSYGKKPKDRVVEYTQFLAERGLNIDLITYDSAKWAESGILELPGVRTHSVKAREQRLLRRRVEKLVIYRIPGGVLKLTERLVTSNRVSRPLLPAVNFSQRVHRRLAGAFHKRIFNPLYIAARPRMLSRVTTKIVAGVDFGNVSRIVTTDYYGIPYAWRLARKYREAPAVTNLDRTPYLRPGEKDTSAALGPAKVG